MLGSDEECECTMTEEEIRIYKDEVSKSGVSQIYMQYCIRLSIAYALINPFFYYSNSFS